MTFVSLRIQTKFLFIIVHFIKNEYDYFVIIGALFHKKEKRAEALLFILLDYIYLKYSLCA